MQPTTPPTHNTQQLVNGVPLVVHVQGQGRPVLVLSAWGYGAAMGKALFGRLPAEGHFQLITVDVPGTGELSDVSSFVYVPRIAQALADVLRSKGLNEVLVIGHSFGAMLAQEMAISHDDVVGRLVLVSPVVGLGGMVPDLHTAMDTLNRLMSGDRGLMNFLFPAVFLKQLKNTLGNVFDELNKPASAKALSGQVWAATHWSAFGRLHHIYQPVLILQGEADPLNNLPQAHQLARSLKHAELKVYPCGYLPFLEMPEEAFRDLSKFIETTQKNSP